jgi:CubicO group peptidase (beta-lactamase class C family)
VLISVLVLCISSCTDENVAPDALYTYQIPEQLDDGWTVSSLSEQGMNTGIITEMTNNILSGQFRGIHSMLIVKNSRLVHEVYFDDYERNSLQIIFSITKSVTSALIGIAIDQGLISSVDAPLLNFFPQYDIQDPQKQNIQLQHVLTLTSGFDWDEQTYPYSDSRNSEYGMVRSSDWMEYVLEKPMAGEPGTTYQYNTGSVHLLSGVIQNASGSYANEFAESNLFQPLDISEYEWNMDAQGFQCTGGTNGGLRLRARDVAKFGYLFMNDGKWQDTQVVPETWVDGLDYFYAAGYGGQTIHIVPELELMIVLLCWNTEPDADIFGPILMTYQAAL